MGLIKTIRTHSGNKEFLELVKLLDAELAERDGADHAFYNTYNGVEDIKHAVVLLHAEKAVAIGGMKQMDPESMEVKRMYVLPESRGKGFASVVLSELEEWARELGYDRCVLETGKRQPEAIRLYEKSSYRRIPNYDPYIGIENSVCFEKKLA